MAEAGSVAEKVKQQADIVRVVGEYVRLKKAGKDFSGLCPFHQEKTPSFTVSPIKQTFFVKQLEGTLEAKRRALISRTEASIGMLFRDSASVTRRAAATLCCGT